MKILPRAYIFILCAICSLRAAVAQPGEHSAEDRGVAGSSPARGITYLKPFFQTISMAVIVFEGIDGSGKSTMAKRMAEIFNAKYIRYPTDKFSILRKYLRGEITIQPKAVFHTFLADILNDQENLKQTGNIFVDRYVFSTIAYEVEKGYTFDEAVKIVEISNPIKPDLVVWLDTPVDVCMERLNRKKSSKGLDRYEETNYLKKVRSNFEKLYNISFMSEWIKTNTNRNVSDTLNSIEKIIAEKVRL